MGCGPHPASRPPHALSCPPYHPIQTVSILPSLPCFFLAFQASAGARDKRGEERPLRPQRLSELGQGLEALASWGVSRLAAGAWGLGRAGGLEGSSLMREP